MAKVVHLKNKKGESFTVTPAGFAGIKVNPKWRNEYDFVGEVDEEEFSAQSESALKPKTENNESGTQRVGKNEKEESSNDIFNDKKAEALKKEEDEKQAAKHLKDAAGLIDKRKFKQAKAEIDAALELSPDNETAKSLLAEIEASTKK